MESITHDAIDLSQIRSHLEDIEQTASRVLANDDAPETLADDRLEIDIRRGLDPEDETRLVFLSGLGARWADGQLEELR